MNRHPQPAEVAVTFSCAGAQLLGVVAAAAQPAALGVVIVVGGPQYRAGSHRQFVLLARALARAGYPTLRYDYRGMGDSEGALRNFETVGADVAAGIGALQAAQPNVQRVVLWGLCDGASAALLYLQEQADPRVAGLALLNPWVRSEASLAKTQVKHYYTQRLKERAFWLKLLSGKVALGALTGLLRNVRTAFTGHPGVAQSQTSYQDRMAQAWATFEGPTLLLLSELDYTAREFVQFSTDSAAWQRALNLRPPTRVTVQGADHTCSTAAHKQTVEAATVQWLASTVAAVA